jgi:glycerol-3-phosphate acyltransferase PlsX
MIAVDVMGGDHAPGAIIAGALQAAQTGIPVLLVGPKVAIIQALECADAQWQSYPISLLDALDVVAMDDDPILGVRKKPNSSLVQAVMSVKIGDAQAVLSAGNSGALMVAASFLLGKAEGVERPAIAGFLPATSGYVLALDLGANVQVRSEHLYSFAHMGAAYLERNFGVINPRVALLSNGHEEGKGTQVIKEAHALLKQSHINFIGNAEPSHVINHDMDVIVCDGFAGNVLLKTCEAVFEWACQLAAQNIHRAQNQLPQNVAQSIAENVVESMHEKAGHKKLSGASLIGVNGHVIVCHGNSDAAAIARAITFAWSIVQQKNVLM